MFILSDFILSEYVTYPLNLGTIPEFLIII
jgi:hypothetical protein